MQFYNSHYSNAKKIVECLIFTIYYIVIFYFNIYIYANIIVLKYFFILLFSFHKAKNNIWIHVLLIILFK